MYGLSWSISTRLLCFALKTSAVEITWGDEKMLLVVVVSNPSPLTRIESISPSVSRRFRKARNKFSVEEKIFSQEEKSIDTFFWV